MGHTKQYQREWRKQNPGKVSSYTRKWRFKLTEAQFQEMVAAQNGTCAICKLIPEDTLCIDHDHKSNKIRALLCRKCNSSIGYFKDDTELLLRVKHYLETYV